jgi:homoserine/homoserine lactone efflux protein
MTLQAWALFCLTETVLCLQPGPSALLVVSFGLTRGRRAGLLATVGVLAANALYFAISASGLVALRTLSAEAFTAIRWTGAAYLIWMGSRLILRSLRAREAQAPPPLAGRRRSFWQGFVTQGANPNLLVYFSAILPQFVDPRAALPPQILVLALSSFAIEFCVLAVYASLAQRAGRSASPRLRPLVDRIGGGLLIGAGAGLASLRRP